ncbi:helix-turn-helix domain-containing protein [Streptomyces violaceoruber]|uniref:helix-turn-helix domain-containing protein n=1 Tax=Streptomyces violaceoruber group TaxID=2867121 RepID=UPI0033CF37FE
METRQRKARRLKAVPYSESPSGMLALALREARWAKGLTQKQAADAIGISASSVQRAESGRGVPEEHVVKGYVDRLGLDAKRAKRLWGKASRPAGQRRALTSAPAVRLLNNSDDFADALRRVWEENGKPSAQTMECRVEEVWKEAKNEYVFLSRSAANRITNRRQLPTSEKQLRSYLHACEVHESRIRVWLAAYQRVRTREREEALAKRKAEEEEEKRWTGWGGRDRAEQAMTALGLDPVEAFPGSSMLPWTVRCRRCGAVLRLRLAAAVGGQSGCRVCRPRRSAYQAPVLSMKAGDNYEKAVRSGARPSHRSHGRSP